MKEIEKLLLNIKCLGFPYKCNKESCSEFICNEINDQSLLELIQTKKDDPYFFSDLGDWLEHDTWTPQDALLLISNISPSGVMIEWNGYPNDWGIWIDEVKIVNAKPLDESNLFYLIPFKHKDSEKFGKLSEEEIKNKLDKLKLYSLKLNRIKKLWVSGQHMKKRYPIEYYLKWAEEKNITVPWLSWAQNNKLIKLPSKASGPFSADKNPLPQKFIDELFAADKEINILRANMGNKIPSQRVAEAKKRFEEGSFSYVNAENIKEEWWDEANGLRYARQEVFLFIAQKDKIKISKTALYNTFCAAKKNKLIPSVLWSKL